MPAKIGETGTLLFAQDDPDMDDMAGQVGQLLNELTTQVEEVEEQPTVGEDQVDFDTNSADGDLNLSADRVDGDVTMQEEGASQQNATAAPSAQESTPLEHRVELDSSPQAASTRPSMWRNVEPQQHATKHDESPHSRSSGRDVA